MKLRIPRVLERRKEIRVVFTLGGELKKFLFSFVFYGDVKKFLDIFTLRFKILPLSQHMRHISYNCITFRSHFAKRASVSFMISSCITQSTGYHVCISHGLGKISCHALIG